MHASPTLHGHQGLQQLNGVAWAGILTSGQGT